MSSTFISTAAASITEESATIDVPGVEPAVVESATAPVEMASDEDEDEIPIPDVSDLVTEDDAPVDNLIQEKLQRFLVECLYSSLKLGVPFLAACDVGLFYGLQEDSLAPDVMLSLDVSVPENWREKRKRSYFVWEFGKPPDVAIEIVSNTKGGELSEKLQAYARAGVAYYAVFDPLEQLSPEILQVYVLHAGRYQRLPDAWMESVGLGLTVWEGEFETKQYDRWLRWRDRKGNLLLTGDEQARQESQRAEQERQRAEQERQRAEQAEQRAKQAEQRAAQAEQRAARLAALLRRHGLSLGESQNIDPDA